MHGVHLFQKYNYTQNTNKQNDINRVIAVQKVVTKLT